MHQHAPDADARPTLAGDLLTRDLATLSQSATVSEAAALMRHLDVRHLPVLGTTRLLGLVHLDDVMGATVDEAGRSVGALARSVPSVCPDDHERSVAAAVTRSRCGAVVVLDQQGRLCGVIAETDLLLDAERRLRTSLRPPRSEPLAATGTSTRG